MTNRAQIDEFYKKVKQRKSGNLLGGGDDNKCNISVQDLQNYAS